jgi:hypothetical protein
VSGIDGTMLEDLRDFLGTILGVAALPRQATPSK